jgi:hypothetical protein
VCDLRERAVDADQVPNGRKLVGVDAVEERNAALLGHE